MTTKITREDLVCLFSKRKLYHNHSS